MRDSTAESRDWKLAPRRKKRPDDDAAIHQGDEAAVCDARARADSDDATMLAAATTSGLLVAAGPNHKAVAGVHSGAMTLAQRRARGAQAFQLRQAADAEEQIARWIVEKRLRPSDGPSADERREDLLDRLRKRQRTNGIGKSDAQRAQRQGGALSPA